MKRLLRHATALILAAGACTAPFTANAQASSGCLLGEIRMFAGDFAPRGWAKLDGQILAIADRAALFSLLGTRYGGDGRETFALPDMRGRVAMHEGQGPGLTNRRLGERLGTEQNAITVNQLPAHSHELRATSASADKSAPEGRLLGDDGNDRIYHDGPADVTMHASAIAETGSGELVNNIQPANVVTYIICIDGYYPSRS